AFSCGTLSVLRHLSADALDMVGDLDVGRRARTLVQEYDVALVEVAVLLESPLTPAEAKVLSLLSAGLSRAQIAAAAFVSVDTVKSQLSSAYRKLGVRGRVDAITAFERLRR